MAATGVEHTTYAILLGPHAGAGPLARLALRQKLNYWHMSELLDSANLITSELVSNAMRLGEMFTMTLRLEEDGEVLRIEVSDGSPAEPVLQANPLAALDNEDPDDNGGCGLVLVDEIADSWGWEPAGPGKTVWARLRLPEVLG